MGWGVGGMTSSLLRIHQGSHLVADAVEFWTLAAGLLPPQALLAACVQGLCEDLKGILATCNPPKDRKVLYDLSIRIESHLGE